MEAHGPNAEQITYWNQQSGPKWVADQERLDRMLAPYGAAAFAALDPRPGEATIDVGCGCGDTTLELGRRVGPTGTALGIDVSAPMLARARERSMRERLANVRFVAADAATHHFPPGATNGLYSRFGVMFFTDPAAAFANLHAALAPGGRLAFACWQPITENPWMLVPLMAAAAHVTLPPPPAPEAPGPFSFGDRDRVRRILGDAGFRNVACEPLTPELVLGGGDDVDAAVEFVLRVGPTSAVLRDVPPEVVAKVAGAVRAALAPYATPRGVTLPSAAWTFAATRDSVSGRG